MTRLISAMFFVVCIFLGGCSGGEAKAPRPSKLRIDKVVRVLMHEPTRYTILAEPQGTVISQITFYVGDNPNNALLFHDVPSDQPMWAQCDPYSEQSWRHMSFCKKLEIHLHSAEDVNGAGWNHGKHGRGMTTIVQ